MAGIKIISDSTCDLTDEILDRYEIDIVPLYVDLGGEMYKDDKNKLTPEFIYDFVDKTGSLPVTSGVPVNDFRQKFEQWHSKGYKIICHTISSEMSCTYQNAVIAAQGMEDVYVVDTRSLSTGVALCVINSAQLAESGMSADKIAENTRELTKKVHATFIIDTLDYLKKGGRCSSLAALGANLLKIKPMIIVDGGKMRVSKKFRGKFEKASAGYIDTLLGDKSSIRNEIAFLTHTGLSREMLDAIESQVRKKIRFEKFYETVAGATVISHSGPGTFGVLFLEK